MSARRAEPKTRRLIGAACGVLALICTPGRARAQNASPPPATLQLRGDTGAAAAAGGATGSGASAADAYDADEDGAPVPPPAPPPGQGQPNYGAPLPPADPTQAYAGQEKAFQHPLPPLRAYATAATRKGQLPTSDPPPNFALPPTIPAPKRRATEADPYAPLGIDVGSLRMTPYEETDVGYDSNPGRIGSAAQGSAFVREQGGMNETSQWSNHQLTSSLEAGYTDFLHDSQFSHPDANANVALRVDASKETALDFVLRGALSTQQPGTPGVNSTLVDEPLTFTFGETAGITQTMSRWTFGLHELIDRGVYQNGRLSNGQIDPLSSESYTDYTIQGRAAYELTPGVSPFVEVDADREIHDQTLDAEGFARNSTGVAEQIGTSFELTRLVTGSIGVGYIERTYQDARLRPLNAPTLNTSLVWTATPLTTVALNTTTTVGQTTVPNASEELSRTAALIVTHALLRNLTLIGTGSFGLNTYQGADIVEHDYLGSIAAQYAMNRWLSLKLAYQHESLVSSTPGASWNDDAVTFGVRVTR